MKYEFNPDQPTGAHSKIPSRSLVEQVVTVFAQQTVDATARVVRIDRTDDRWIACAVTEDNLFCHQFFARHLEDGNWLLRLLESSRMS